MDTIAEDPVSVEVRCPLGPRRLFMKLKLEGTPITVNSENLMEFSCADCRKALQRQGTECERVLHFYNFIGEWVRTTVLR